MSEFAENISIPYGAIKRSKLEHMYGMVHIFQFLMVRLKELLAEWQVDLEDISIPYGAIKSRRHRLLKMA